MMTFSQAQIDSARLAAPRPVQDMLEQGTLLMGLMEIAKARGLHVDQFGVTADLARNMLIGLLGPTQFVSELRSAGIEEGVANGILQDLNAKVFKPLNEKVRGAEPTKAPVTTPKPQPAPQTPRPTPVQPPLPAKPPVPAPVPVPPAPKPIPPPVAQPVQAPAMRTMAHDVEEMRDGKVPPPFFANPVPPPASSYVPPPPRPTPPPVFPTTPPPPREVSSLTPTAEEVSSSLKKYGIDPYRETVE